MKFLLLVYTDEALMNALPVAETDDMMRGCLAKADDLRAAGRLLDFQQLEAPATAKSVRIRGARVSVVDGPFAEAKEAISYALWEVRSKEEAVEWTSRFLALHRDNWPGWEGEATVLKVFGPEDFPGGAPA